MFMSSSCTQNQKVLEEHGEAKHNQLIMAPPPATCPQW